MELQMGPLRLRGLLGTLRVPARGATESNLAGKLDRHTVTLTYTPEIITFPPTEFLPVRPLRFPGSDQVPPSTLASGSDCKG